MRDYQRLRSEDARDVSTRAHSISSPLHYSNGTPQCKDPTQCKTCYNAARLAVQHYRPIIEKRVVQHMVHHYDAGCTMPHPGSD